MLNSALVGGELSASRLAALPPGKKSSVHIGYEAGWPQNRSGRFGQEKILDVHIVTRQVISGFFGLRIALLDNHQAGLQILITLQKVTGTITHKIFSTSIHRCSLYEFGEQVCTQSALGLGFYYSVGLSGMSLLSRVLCYDRQSFGQSLLE
jgi:hypothetical protein